MKRIKLTMLGKIVFIIYNIIMFTIAYYVANMLGATVNGYNIYLVICIICWLRIFLTPFYIYLILEV